MPYLLTKFLWTPYFSFKVYYVLFFLLAGLPVATAYWNIMSKISGPVRSNVIMPGKPIEEYLDIKDPELKAKYNGMNKIPLQLFYDAYFEGKIEVKGASRACWLVRRARRGPELTIFRLPLVSRSHEQATFWMSSSTATTGPCSTCRGTSSNTSSPCSFPTLSSTTCPRTRSKSATTTTEETTSVSHPGRVIGSIAD